MADRRSSSGRENALWSLRGVCTLLPLLIGGPAAAALGKTYAGGASEAPVEDRATIVSESSSTGDSRETDSDQRRGTVAKDEPTGRQSTVDAWHAGISAAVEASARRVDAFFADDRFYADATESYARLSVQSAWESGEDTESQVRVRIRVDLPGTEERVRLFVEGGDPDATEGDGSESLTEAFDDNDYNIGLEAQLRNTGQWDVRPGLGAKAATPPDPFVRIRATRYERLDSWLMRFSAGAAEFLDDGTELQTRLDFDHRFSPDWLLRSTSRVRYLDSKDRTEAIQQFSVFQKVNDRVGLAYDVGVRADDDPDWETDHYFTQFRARFRAHKKWLYIEAKPQLLFREEDDYDPSFRFALRADAVFGERYR